MLRHQRLVAGDDRVAGRDVDDAHRDLSAQRLQLGPGGDVLRLVAPPYLDRAALPRDAAREAQADAAVAAGHERHLAAEIEHRLRHPLLLACCAA